MAEALRYYSLKMGIFLFLIACHPTASAQINLKVGYNFSFTNLSETEAIFERFNSRNPQAEKSLSPINIYHGIELGIRYKINNIGLDLGLSSVSGSSEALNVMLSDGSLGRDEWRISLLNYSFGLEYIDGNFGIGGTIGSQRIGYRTTFATGNGTKSVYSDSVLASKFYFILEVPSNKVAFSIRPFISTTWQPYNVRDVEIEFDPLSNIPADEFDQNIIVYGLSFLFYNGPQN